MAAATAMMGAAVVSLLAGVLSPGERFAGFGNPAPMTVAAHYILARAVEKTGLLNPMGLTASWVRRCRPGHSGAPAGSFRRRDGVPEQYSDSSRERVGRPPWPGRP